MIPLGAAQSMIGSFFPAIGTARTQLRKSGRLAGAASTDARLRLRAGGAGPLLLLLLPAAPRPPTRRCSSPASARRSAAPEPKPVPRFTETAFITADGQLLPLRRWLPRAASQRR